MSERRYGGPDLTDGNDLSLRPRPGETAAETVERVIRAAHEAADPGNSTRGVGNGPVAGRFVLLSHPDGGYCTSWDTWDEAFVAFAVPIRTHSCFVACEDSMKGRYCKCNPRPRMPGGFRLEDGETGRIWYPGAEYEWEAAST